MKILKFIICCSVGAVLSFSVPQSVNAASSKRMDIPLNRSELIVVPEKMAEVTVADPMIADVVIHGGTRFSVLAKKIGTTSVRVLGESNEVLKDLDIVVGYDLPAIRKTVKGLFPEEIIGVEMVGSNVAVTGAVTDANVASKIVKVVEQYVSDSSSGSEGILNLMKLRTGQQVMLRVRVGEIRRSAVKNLGVNLGASLDTAGAAVKAFAGSGFIPDEGTGIIDVVGNVFVPDSSRGAVLAGFNIGRLQVSSAIDALERDGLFRLLAEPNLVAISGEKATFLAGGEIPIPVPQGQGEVALEYKEYGISVEFTPYVLSANRIRLVVAPEVSELDFSNAVTIAAGGSPIPALRTRSASTTVELAPGEAFMIAGLLQDDINTTIEEVPGIAEIPIFSSLFRSTAFQRNETELVIAVTPYLTDPVAASDIRLPSEDYRAPSMMEQVFYGSLGSLQGDVTRISQTPALEGPVGLMLD